MKESPSELKQRPDNGCYIWGLFLEGARWDVEKFELSESKPKELYTDMPVMWLIPTANRKQPETGMYLCPVYKTLTRAGNDYVVYYILSAYNIQTGDSLVALGRWNWNAYLDKTNPLDCLLNSLHLLITPLQMVRPSSRDHSSKQLYESSNILLIHPPKITIFNVHTDKWIPTVPAKYILHSGWLCMTTSPAQMFIHVELTVGTLVHVVLYTLYLVCPSNVRYPLHHWSFH